MTEDEWRCQQRQKVKWEEYMAISKNPLILHITCLLLVKILLLFMLWKWCFSEPLTEQSREAGIHAAMTSNKFMTH